MPVRVCCLIISILILMAGESSGQSWWSTLASGISTFAVEPETEPVQDDWLSNFITDTLDAVDDVIDLSVESVTAASWFGVKSAEKIFKEAPSWETVKKFKSKFEGYNLNLDVLKGQLPSWSSFISSNPSIDDVETDNESKRIDMLNKEIHAYNSYKESQEAHTNLPPECYMNAPQLIRYAGYPCSTFTTTTTDGYVLTLHRIPFGKKDSKSRKNDNHGSRRRRNLHKPVVFLQHGILADSSTWCSSGNDRSLAFLLADEGFDVWMGNSRGNMYSRAHVTFNPDINEEYWRFSWQDMAEYDLPAMIDSVLKTTRREKLYYIGHSQGTLMAFARLAENPKFNDKIHMLIGLGPVATLGNITSPIRALSSFKDVVHFGITMMGGAEILPRTELSKWLTTKLQNTTKNDPLAYHGSNLLLFLVGFNVYHYHRDRLLVMLAHTPSGTSLHNLIHMAQLVSSGKMQKWDHWLPDDNLKYYGQSSAPEYDVSKITTPLALFVGDEDKLADPVDAGLLASKLQTLVRYELLKEWDHLDFLWGERAPEMLYTKIIDLINNWELKHGKLNDEL